MVVASNSVTFAQWSAQLVLLRQQLRHQLRQTTQQRTRKLMKRQQTLKALAPLSKRLAIGLRCLPSSLEASLFPSAGLSAAAAGSSSELGCRFYHQRFASGVLLCHLSAFIRM